MDIPKLGLHEVTENLALMMQNFIFFSVNFVKTGEINIKFEDFLNVQTKKTLASYTGHTMCYFLHLL